MKVKQQQKMKASHQAQDKPDKSIQGKAITSVKSIPSANQPIPRNIVPNPSQIKFTYHNYTNLTNEQYLLHSLKLLGVTQTQYVKQTKLSMTDEIFGKNQHASTTKQFFFIVITCMRYLCNQEEFGTIKMWYPPRTVNEQLEFKKALYNIFPRLQGKNKIPKNVLISKSFLMGETPTPKIIQFLRILSQLALRSEYLQKYSKCQRLIQIHLKQQQDLQQSPNDINRTYIYPFVPGQSSTPPIPQEQVQSLKRIYKTHIEIYRKKILNLVNKYPKQQPIMCQSLITQIVQQKQLADMLSKKIPKSVLSDNRAFDRRKLIDQSQYVWHKLHSIKCINIIKTQQTDSVLKYQGEIDKILMKWETPSGINKMVDILNITQKLKSLQENCQQRNLELKLFQEKLLKQLKSYK